MPAFYHYLQAQETTKQIENAEDLRTQIAKLVDAADPTGPFFLGLKLGFVDVQLAPWLLRMTRVLKPYRGWPDPEEGSRWARWVDAVENHTDVKATTSTDDLYLDSYERYAGMMRLRPLAAYELLTSTQRTGPTPAKWRMQSTLAEGYLDCINI